MLVQPSEVTPFLGLDREMTPGEQVAIRSVLDDIEAEVEALIGSLEVLTHTETLTVPDPWPQYGPVIFTPSYHPIAAVTNVTINGATLETSGYTYDYNGIKVFGGFTRNLMAPAYTLAATVTYSAGHPERVLAQIRPLVKRRAVRLLNKIGDEAIGTDRVTLEGYSSTWMSESFSTAEEELIRRAAGTHWTISSPDTTEQELMFPQTYWGPGAGW